MADVVFSRASIPPRCNAVMRCNPSASGGAVTCGSCAFAFCASCSFPAPHAPATCDMVAAWQGKGGMVEASAEDLANWLTIKKVAFFCDFAPFVQLGAFFFSMNFFKFPRHISADLEAVPEVPPRHHQGAGHVQPHDLPAGRLGLRPPLLLPLLVH